MHGNIPIRTHMRRRGAVFVEVHLTLNVTHLLVMSLLLELKLHAAFSDRLAVFLFTLLQVAIQVGVLYLQTTRQGLNLRNLEVKT